MCQQAVSESAVDYEPIKLVYFKALYLNKASDPSHHLQNLQMTNFLHLPPSHGMFPACLYFLCIQFNFPSIAKKFFSRF